MGSGASLGFPNGNAPEDDKAKYLKMPATASTTKSVQLTKGEAMLAMQVPSPTAVPGALSRTLFG